MITEEFTPEQAAVVERFEAGQAAEESLRERVAGVLHDVDIVACSAACFTGWPDCGRAPKFRAMADAAIAVMRGEAS